MNTARRFHRICSQLLLLVLICGVAPAGETVGTDVAGLLDRLVQKNWEVREKLIKEIKVLPTEGLYAGLQPVITDPTADHKRRLAAMAVAAARGLGEARGDLLALVSSEDAELKKMAVLCLGWLGDPGLLPEFERLAAEDPSTEIRVAAIESIDRTGAEGSLETFHGLIGPGERNVRISALYMLGDLVDPASLEKIVSLLNDSDAQVRRYAMSVMRKYEAADVLPLIDGAWADLSAKARLDAVRTLGQIDDPAVVAQLGRLAGKGSADLKVQVAAALGHIDGPEAVALLRQQYPGSEGKLQVQLIRSIGAQKDAGSVAMLLESLKTEDPRLRGAVIEALVQIGDTGALPDLIELLIADQTGPELRAALVGALGRFGDASVNPYLLEMLEAEEDDQARINLMLALGNLPQDGLWKNLAPYLQDDNPQVANAAIYAISLLQDPGALEALYPMLRSPDMNLQISVLTLLAEMKPEGASSRVLALLDSDNVAVKSTAIQVLGVLEDRSVLDRIRNELESATDTNVRVASVMTLGELKDTHSAARLAELLESGGLDMKMASMEALGKLGNQTARTALRKQMAEGEFWIAHAARISLARIGDREVLDGILKELDGPNPDLRAETARMLGEVAGKSVIEPLLGLLDDTANIGVPSILVRDFMVGSTFYSGSGDRKQGVRDAAVEALKMATGKSFDYPVFGSEVEKAAGVKCWRDWWAAEGDTFEPPAEPQYPQQ